MGSMTENIADKAINDTRIVKQFTNPVKEPIDSDINLFDLLDNRAKRDPEGAMIEYKLRMAPGSRTAPRSSATWSSIWPKA